MPKERNFRIHSGNKCKLRCILLLSETYAVTVEPNQPCTSKYIFMLIYISKFEMFTQRLIQNLPKSQVSLPSDLAQSVHRAWLKVGYIQVQTRVCIMLSITPKPEN